MRGKLFRLLLIGGIVQMSGIVNARTLYVGDEQTGAKYRKIQDAVKAAEPGDDVIVYSGTYKETVSFPRSGEKGKRITVSAYPGHIVNVIPGRKIKKTPAKVAKYPGVYCWENFSQVKKLDDYSIWEPAGRLRLKRVYSLKQCDARIGSWYFDKKNKKLYVRGTGMRQPDELDYMLVNRKENAFLFKTKISYITIKGINAAFAANGAVIAGKASHITIENCKFFCNDVAGIHVTGVGHSIKNNECFFNNQYGIQIRYWIEYSEILNNLCYYNGPNNGETTSTSLPCDISIYSRGRHVLFSGNIVDGLHQYAMRNKYGGNHSVMFRNNVVRGCFYWQGKCMENNTIIVNDLGTRFGMYINRVRSGAHTDIDIIDPRGTQRRSNIIWPAVNKKDPKFVDPAWRDFRLQGDSPYFGKGAYPSYAAALYIDPVNGNDDNDGLSVKTPLKTIEFAYTVLHPDYTLYFLPGEYKEKMVLDIREKGYRSLSARLYLSGYSKKSPLVFRAYGKSGKVVFTDSVELNDSKFVHFDGIIFKGAKFEIKKSNDVAFQNCVFDNKNAAMEITDSKNVSFNQCTFANAKTGVKLEKADNVRIVNSLFANVAESVSADQDSKKTLYQAYDKAEAVKLDADYFLPANSDLSFASSQFSFVGANGEKPADRLKVEELKVAELSPKSATILWQTPKCLTDTTVTLKNLATGEIREFTPVNTFQIMGVTFDLTFKSSRYFTIERNVSFDGLSPDTDYLATLKVTDFSKDSVNAIDVKFKTPAKYAAPTTYYVSTTGNDDDNGKTPNTAWRTFLKAGATAAPGDTVVVQPGVYAETLAPRTSGTKERPITYKSAKLGEAVIDLKKSLAAGIEVMNVDYIHIEGFSIKGGKYLMGHNFIIGYSKGIRIAKCRVKYPEGASFTKLKMGHGGMLAVASPGLEVVDNVIMCGYTGISIGGCDGAKITHNTIFGEGNYGIVVIPDNKNESYTVKDNIIYKPVMGYKVGPAFQMMNLQSKLVCDYNLYWIPKKYKGTVGRLPGSPYYETTKDWRAGTAFGAHSIDGEPIFENPEAGDFTLKKGSPGYKAADDGSDMGARL